MLSDKQKKDDYLARTRHVRYRLQYKQRKKREDYQKQRGRMGTKNARHRSQVTLRKKRGDKLKQKQRGRGGDQRPPRLKVFLRFCFIAAPPRHQGERKRGVGRSGNKSKCFKKWSVLSSDAFSDPSPLPSAVFSLKIRLSVAQVPGLSSKPISETESRWLGVPPGGSIPDPRNRPNSDTQSRRQGADLTG